MQDEARARLYQPAARERGILAWAQRGLVAGVLTLAVGLLLFEVWTFVSWPPPVYDDPEVLNLTRQGQAWDVYYGASPRCGAVDCYLTAAYPAGRYTKSTVLPVHEFPLSGYQDGDLVYYRTHVVLPKALQQAHESLLFHSLYIWAARYDLYVDGTLIESGGEELMNVALPPDVTQRGEFTLAIKVDPSGLRYQGLAHFGELLIGPKSKLAPLRFLAHDFQTSYYLWYLLPRVAFCAMFCLIFLALSRSREHFYFILYAFTASLRIFLYSAYAKDLVAALGPRGPAIYLDCLGQVFLLLFVHHFFRRASRGPVRLAYALLVALAAYGLVAFTKLPLATYQSLTLGIGTALRVLALGYGTYSAARLLVYLHHTRFSRSRLWAASLLLVFFVVSLGDIAATALGFYREAFSQLVPWFLELSMFVLLAAFTAVDFGRVTAERSLLRDEVDRQREEIERARVAHAVARTTQMLAHDVRKPFSLFRVLFDRLAKSSDPGEVQHVVDRFLPDFEAAFKSVEAMLADLLEVGSDGTPMVAPSIPEELVLEALRDVLRTRGTDDVVIDYAFAHSHPLLVDAAKCTRVFANLIDNAVAAMHGSGRLWIGSADQIDEARGVVHLWVGNTGSFVPEEERSRIFEAFYTKGKRGGTGLGLAVCEKVVRAHGGRIWCESDQEQGTVFHVLLPAAAAISTPSAAALPRRSGELHSGLAASQSQATSASRTSGPVEVLVLEDDPFMADAWREALGEGGLVMQGATELWALLARAPDLLDACQVIVLDYYLGEDETGAQVAAKLRQETKARLVLASDVPDGAAPEDAFDLVIAKAPCDLETLLELLREAQRAG